MSFALSIIAAVHRLLDESPIKLMRGTGALQIACSKYLNSEDICKGNVCVCVCFHCAIELCI